MRKCPEVSKGCGLRQLSSVLFCQCSYYAIFTVTPCSHGSTSLFLPFCHLPFTLSLAPRGHLLIHSLHFRVLIGGGTAALISRGASNLHPRRSASSAEGVCRRSLPTICHGHTKLFGKLCGPNSPRWRTGPSLLPIQMTLI